MPPRGVKKGTKRARQYEHIRKSQRSRGRSEARAEEIAARTVNKERARSGQSRTRSKTSMRGKAPSVRGGHRSGTDRPKGRTREQLYNEAKKLGVAGRSRMTKQQLHTAVERRK
ncbi:MAG: plasmid stabilization protein [Acidimicrobiia bacterium]